MAVYSGDPKRIEPGTCPEIRPDARDMISRFIKERPGKSLAPAKRQGEEDGRSMESAAEIP
jgi:hypothetical protein